MSDVIFDIYPFIALSLLFGRQKRHHASAIAKGSPL